ncbi:hypothetical protein [Catellatospora methionotrophica]|uniref:hypothetical protein n=1 Tax=Catellatospora methionotrophica TaxID=121620 RepID=UPI0033C38FAE
MTKLPTLLDDSNDHTARHCLACASLTGHTPHCPATDRDATELLVEHLPDGLTRTWLISGVHTA